ncbi:hypothetical protein [Streptomyces sp. OP7]|uniref:hypothetical protein n=1 Tax=Streptomyces sp. OP7 TaxID=3142462 RepID=UPI0032E8A435
MKALGERITVTRIRIARLRALESRKPQMARKRRRLERKLVLLEMAARWRRRVIKPSHAQVVHEQMNARVTEQYEAEAKYGKRRAYEMAAEKEREKADHLGMLLRASLRGRGLLNDSSDFTEPDFA